MIPFYVCVHFFFFFGLKVFIFIDKFLRREVTDIFPSTGNGSSTSLEKLSVIFEMFAIFVFCFFFLFLFKL